MDHLGPLIETAGLEVFYDSDNLSAGDQWDDKIKSALDRCELFLLFVSPACLKSQYCVRNELLAALNRHARGLCRIIPVILKPCAWDMQLLPNGSQQLLNKFQALPEGGKAVMLNVIEAERGQVWTGIVRELARQTGHTAGALPGPRPAPGPAGVPARPVPRLLPYLCDQQPAEYAVFGLLKQWTQAHLILILRASADDCPDKFAERLVERQLAKRLAQLTPGIGVAPLATLQWPGALLGLRKPAQFVEYFHEQLAGCILDNVYASEQDLVHKLLAASMHRLFLIGLPEATERSMGDAVQGLALYVQQLAPHLGNIRLGFLLWTEDPAAKQIDPIKLWKLGKVGGWVASPAPLMRVAFKDIQEWARLNEVRAYAELDSDMLRQAFRDAPESLSMREFVDIVLPLLARSA